MIFHRTELNTTKADWFSTNSVLHWQIFKCYVWIQFLGLYPLLGKKVSFSVECNWYWSVCVIVIVCVIYAGPLFSVKNGRKKLKHFRFSVYVKGKVNYSNTVILINLLLLFKKQQQK